MRLWEALKRQNWADATGVAATTKIKIKIKGGPNNQCKVGKMLQI